MSEREKRQIGGKYLSGIFNKLGFESLLEVGTGEATTIADIAKNSDIFKSIFALDISLSRILYAKQFCKNKNVNISLIVADMFQLPFEDSSIDIVFTCHCIEPNTGKEIEAIQELYRIAKKYVVLLEPSYELGNEATRERIEKHCYIRDLSGAIRKLGYKVIAHRLFNVSGINNNSALTVIEKQDGSQIKKSKIDFACPHCNKPLIRANDTFYCNECYLIYPIFCDIPVLTSFNATLCSKYLKFIALSV